MFERYRTIHFVGIGGIGMSGIAEVLHNLGYEVTGSDLKESDTVTRLRYLGIKVSIGHRPENIDDAHVVVISSAVSDENPEVVAARERSVPVIPRAEMLAELGRLKYGILIAGAHGKTTTTSLIATILGHAGFDPTVVIGGKLRATGSNARLGKGDFIIAEADESDGSFLKLTPTIAVVTNIDREHMDFFKTMDTLKDAFVSFINKVPFYGLSILCVENELIREILPRIHRRYITYGFSEDADVLATNVEKGFLSVSFDVKYKGNDMGRFLLPMPGMHSILNCLAGIIVAMELKVEFPRIREALQSFSGIQRRFEFKGEVNGIRFFDDYGHHPAEIRATLKAAKESLTSSSSKGGRVFVLFQPHRYTRTRDLLHEFGNSFSDADVLCVMDIYPAGEKPIEGVNGEAVVKAIKDNGHKNVVSITDRNMLTETIKKRLRPHDLFLTIGAGDVWKTGEELLKRMKSKG
ncbi:MAG: UDP-N-acetylmuramate--L-alanine ligase [Nitrospirae bacterium]|nr:UDP-N-acetylmuramate--L-alanine ligase [Nitrospirota bacterium]MCL5421274.1 UDP-N-acetylmuramate--L-alanine ligase [Nitrospirota bacterium]